MSKTIRVDDEVYSSLLQVKATLMQSTQRSVSFNEVMKFLVSMWKDEAVTRSNEAEAASRQ